VPAGHVAVYETNDSASAHLGELSVTSLKARGCAGAVIDGGCRDVDFILREDFPVFARYTTPQDCTARWELVEHGDVVVPRTLVDEVLAEAEAKAQTESEIRAAVRGGLLPLEAYERFGTF